MRLMFNSIQASTSSSDKTYLICLQVGQSNAQSAGDAVLNDVPVAYRGEQSNVLKTSFNIPDWDFLPMEFNNTNFSRWNSGNIENVPVSIDSAGAEIKLWKDIADETGKNILLVHLAYGAEGFISGNSTGNGAWNLTRNPADNTGIAWEHLDDSWDALDAYILANNLTTENGFIYWFQGENDLGNVNYFTTDLPTAFTRFRAKFGEDVHIYSGEVNAAKGGSWATFAANQASYIDPAGEYTLMSNANKTWIDTDVHLDFTSQLLLADEIKAAYLASL